jgi:hypothetical protein
VSVLQLDVTGAHVEVNMCSLMMRRVQKHVQVVDIVDGPLCKEEFDLISQAMQDETCAGAASGDSKDRFEEIVKHLVRWRCAPMLPLQPRSIPCTCLLYCGTSLLESARLTAASDVIHFW